jgi:large subunit ribosomal protein L24e
MAKCSFCDSIIERGTGKMVIENDGKIFRFCSLKCEKNLLKLKRDPRKVNWVRKKKR